MLSNQKIFRLKSLRVSSALSGAMVFGLLSLTPISHSCGGKSKTKSSQTSAPSGDVEVTATVNTEEDPTEFKEADEAIMIGGVNLEVSKQHQIKVYGITSTGEQLISSTESASPTFKITIPARTYTIITVTSADGVRKAVLPGNYGPLAKAVININRVTGVAAEIVRIAGKKALQGNADAKDIIANNRIPMAALHTLASNAVEVIRIQKEKTNQRRQLI